MPSNSDRVLSDDGFIKIELKLALARAAATAPPDAPESWLKRTFSPPAPSSRQNAFNIAVVDVLEELADALAEAVARQGARLQHLDRDMTELRSLSASLRDLRERSEQEQEALRERFAAAEAQLAQLRQEQGQRIEQLGREQGEKINQLSAGQGDLARELRERIQHLLDEQRVCIRQLSLKTSEEAVLSDRARRAAELRLEELARRLPEKPA